MVKLSVNAVEIELDIPSDTPLLWVLRDELGLIGTRYGCGIATCGACTVHVDGRPRRACVTPVSSVSGSSVVTIEGLSEQGDHPVQRAWQQLQVPQCGYCQSGQMMSAAALLDKSPHPSDAEIDQSMSGNLCRCGTYPAIRSAIHLASELTD